VEVATAAALHRKAAGPAAPDVDFRRAMARGVWRGNRALGPREEGPARAGIHRAVELIHSREWVERALALAQRFRSTPLRGLAAPVSGDDASEGSSGEESAVVLTTLHELGRRGRVRGAAVSELDEVLEFLRELAEQDQDV
jgi:hypothetical protein